MLVFALVFAASLLPSLVRSDDPPASNQSTQSTEAPATPATPQRREDGLVSVSSNGQDVRQVIHSLFAQAGKNYVLEPNVRFALFLSLNDVEFDEALQIVCHLAQLDFEIQNGIYFISKARQPGSGIAPVRFASQAPPQPPRPVGKLDESVLRRLVTTRFDRTPLRQVLGEIGRQAQVTIEFDPAVPVDSLSLDAYLIRTSLKYALDVITNAARLRWELTDHKTILIRPLDPTRVTVRDRGS